MQRLVTNNNEESSFPEYADEAQLNSSKIFDRF